MECSLHVDAKDERCTRGAHHGDVESRDDADTEMQLKKHATRRHAEIMKLSHHLLAIHG